MHPVVTSTLLGRQCLGLHVMFTHVVSAYTELLELMSLRYDARY